MYVPVQMERRHSSNPLILPSISSCAKAPHSTCCYIQWKQKMESKRSLMKSVRLQAHRWDFNYRGIDGSKASGIHKPTCAHGGKWWRWFTRDLCSKKPSYLIILPLQQATTTSLRKRIFYGFDLNKLGPSNFILITVCGIRKPFWISILKGLTAYMHNVQRALQLHWLAPFTPRMCDSKFRKRGNTGTCKPAAERFMHKKMECPKFGIPENYSQGNPKLCRLRPRKMHNTWKISCGMFLEYPRCHTKLCMFVNTS